MIILKQPVSLPVFFADGERVSSVDDIKNSENLYAYPVVFFSVEYFYEAGSICVLSSGGVRFLIHLKFDELASVLQSCSTYESEPAGKYSVSVSIDAADTSSTLPF